MPQDRVAAWSDKLYRRTGALVPVPPPAPASPRYIIFIIYYFILCISLINREIDIYLMFRFVACGVCRGHVGHAAAAVACDTCCRWHHLHCLQPQDTAAVMEADTWLCADCG